MVYGTHTNVAFSCGLTAVGGFDRSRTNYYGNRPRVKDIPAAGTGYAVAAFVHTKVCKDAYEEIKANHKIVFQSEVRRNNNSDNLFFFVIYDTRK